MGVGYTFEQVLTKAFAAEKSPENLIPGLN
jgi:hypothetical protein